MMPKSVLRKYKKVIKNGIINVMEMPRSDYVHNDTLLGDNSERNKKFLQVAHRIRQKHMKEGAIAEIIIGNFYGWENLGKCHETGLDCRKIDNSIIMDVKNKYNTCNSSSEKCMLDKLAEYKKRNQTTRCVWGIVNPHKTCTKLTETIIHNGQEIEKIQGDDLLKMVFTYEGKDYSDKVVKYVKLLLSKFH